jgi:hypothetical protein
LSYATVKDNFNAQKPKAGSHVHETGVFITENQSLKKGLYIMLKKICRQ